MTTTEWFSSLSKDERKQLLSELHEVRRTMSHQHYINILLMYLEMDHVKAGK